MWTSAKHTIPVKEMWEILKAASINVTVVKALKPLYQETVLKIKNGNPRSSDFKVTKGLKHVLSLLLFNMYINWALEKWKIHACMWMPVENIILYTGHYMDDQVLIAQDKDNLKYMARKLTEKQLQKTHYLCAGGGGQPVEDLSFDNNKRIKDCSILRSGTNRKRACRTSKQERSTNL